MCLKIKDSFGGAGLIQVGSSWVSFRFPWAHKPKSGFEPRKAPGKAPHSNLELVPSLAATRDRDTTRVFGPAAPVWHRNQVRNPANPRMCPSDSVRQCFHGNDRPWIAGAVTCLAWGLELQRAYWLQKRTSGGIMLQNHGSSSTQGFKERLGCPNLIRI